MLAPSSPSYVRPEFVPRVRAGATIVVAGEAFGCGSSREEAVKALKQVGAGGECCCCSGASILTLSHVLLLLLLQSGVEAVIAKSFAFIYARNQPNMSLLGVVVRDEAFYAAAAEGADVEVDVAARQVRQCVDGGGGGEREVARGGHAACCPRPVSSVPARFAPHRRSLCTGPTAPRPPGTPLR